MQNKQKLMSSDLSMNPRVVHIYQKQYKHFWWFLLSHDFLYGNAMIWDENFNLDCNSPFFLWLLYRNSRQNQHIQKSHKNIFMIQAWKKVVQSGHGAISEFNFQLFMPSIHWHCTLGKTINWFFIFISSTQFIIDVTIIPL